MERRLSEATSQLNNLQQECDVTMNLLKKLVHLNKTMVCNLKTCQDPRNKASLLLDVFRFQYESYHKILELNLSLDEYVNDIVKSHPSLADHENNVEVQSVQTTFEPVVSNTKTNNVVATEPELPTQNNVVATEPELPTQNNVVATEPELPTNVCKLDQIVSPTLTTSQSNIESQTKYITRESANNTPLRKPTTESMVQKVFKEHPVLNENRISDKLRSLVVTTTKKNVQKAIPNIAVKHLDLKLSSLTSSSSSSIKSDFYEEGDEDENEEKVSNVVPLPLPARRMEIESHPVPNVNRICMIGHLVNPGKFYIQLASTNSSLIDTLSTELGTCYKNVTFNYESKSDALSRLGRFCAAEIDKVWYRLEVLNWQANEDNTVTVQLVDFGEEIEINYHGLTPLKPYMTTFARQAVRCHMSNLYPIGSTNENRLNEWSTASIQGFAQLLGDLETTSFRVVHSVYCDEKQSYAIDLLKCEEDDEETLAERILDCDLAMQIADDTKEIIRNSAMVKQICMAQGLCGIDSKMATSEILDVFFSNDFEDEPQTVNEAVMHYNPRDEAETCKNLRPDGTCYKGSNCKFRHIPLKDGYTTDKQPVYSKAYAELELPALEQKVTVIITHVVSVDHFYAQIFPENINDVLTLPQLIKDMNSSPILKKTTEFKLMPAVGELVIAKHWNKYWYRAQVRDLHLDENVKRTKIEVFYVDFGDTATLPIVNIKSMLPEFLKLPFQAVECRFHNVSPRSDVDFKSARSALEALCLGRVQIATVTSNQGHLEVLLHNKKGKDIGEWLIAQNFAEQKRERLLPASHELILVD